jgi:hypothetical protein
MIQRPLNVTEIFSYVNDIKFAEGLPHFVHIIYIYNMFDVLTDIFRDVCVGFMVSPGKVGSCLHDCLLYLIITIIILRVIYIYIRLRNNL